MTFVSLRSSRNDPMVAASGAPIVGHIRMGETVPTAGGKTKPAVADGWIITTPDRAIADAVAAFYHTDVAPFTAQKSSDQWAIRTGTTGLNVRLAPTDPDRVARHELFGGKGLVRRCSMTDSGTRVCWTSHDHPQLGRVEHKSPCVCEADIAANPDRPSIDLCKPALRLNFFLDGPDIGVLGAFAFKSGSEQACQEMPAVYAVLNAAGAQQLFAGAVLVMDHRSSQGGTKRFTVPVLRLRFTADQVNALAASAVHASAALTAGTPAPSTPELPAGEEHVPDHVVRGWRTHLQALPDHARRAASAELHEAGINLRRLVPASQRPAIEAIIAAHPIQPVDHDDVVDAEIVED